jgi:uncharacterized membrane protein YtjA (UPF0391 family)
MALTWLHIVIGLVIAVLAGLVGFGGVWLSGALGGAQRRSRTFD